MSAAPDRPLELLASPVRRAIVDMLANLSDADQLGLTATDLGERLHIHPTTARFHLDQLETHGLVASYFQRGRVGRPRKLYRSPSRPLPDARGETPLHALTRLLTESWQRTDDGEAVTPEQAGRRWALEHAAEYTDSDTFEGTARGREQARTPGAWLGKVGQTVDLLHQWGYQPEVRTEDGGRTAELTLVDCPLLPLAEDHPAVVCGVHRGLLRGALEAVGEPDTSVSLRPLVRPRVCTATITTKAELRPPGRRAE